MLNIEIVRLSLISRESLAVSSVLEKNGYDVT